MKNALFTMIICMAAISFAWAQERPSMIANRNYTEKLDSVVEYQGEKKGYNKYSYFYYNTEHGSLQQVEYRIGQRNEKHDYRIDENGNIIDRIHKQLYPYSNQEFTYEKDHLEYDENGNLVLSLNYQYVWDENDYIQSICFGKRNVYDDHGNLKEYEEFGYSTCGNYCVSKRKEYQYDEHNHLINVLNYTLSANNTLYLVNKSDYVYNDANLLETETRYTITSPEYDVLVPYYQLVYSYYDNGNKKTYTKRNWSEDHWEDAEKQEYTYTASNMNESQTHYEAVDGNWVEQKKYEWYYDASDRLTDSLLYDWKESDWVLKCKTVLSYNEYGLEEITLYGGTTPSEKFSYEYDENGNCTLYGNYSQYDAETGNWNKTKETINMTYDAETPIENILLCNSIWYDFCIHDPSISDYHIPVFNKITETTRVPIDKNNIFYYSPCQLENGYFVSLSCDDAKGTVSGDCIYKENETATVWANGKNGYQFSHWSDGNTNNPRTITVTQDIDLEAFFEPAVSPIGAEWYYEIVNDNGSITYQHLQYTNDTVINHKDVKIIVRTNTLYDKGEHQTVTHEYIYNEDNKVFWWNKTLNEFTKLYDFGLEPGDEWEIKVGTEILTMHVDAVDTTHYDGKTYPIQRVSDDNGIFNGTIICDIGHLTSFFPEKLMNEKKSHRVEGIRCYWIDGNLIFKNGDKDCDAVYEEMHSSIDETTNASFSLYPNPTNGTLYIESQGNASTFNISNMLGQTVMTGNIADNQIINVSGLDDGMYFICIGQRTVKFVVRK